MMNTADLYSIFLQHPRIVTDSRRIAPDCIFFALKGESFDGNKFAADALARGAAYAIVDDANLRHEPRCIEVPDVLTALQDLARYHRRQFHIPVIGITGSNGKTTTKELVSSVLGSHYRVHFTQGNYNNHIGVPLTLLAMPFDAEMAVIEMGANHQGEIDALSQICEPTHGLITNIGKAHLEGFGGIEGVKRGKSELYRFLSRQQGTACINCDEPFLEELAASVSDKIFYGRKKPVHSDECLFIPVELLATQPFVQASFTSNNKERVVVNSRLIGAYNFGNISTAIALGSYFEVPDRKIVEAIENYIPGNMRSQLIQKGSNTFILDAYNANPSSTREAVLSFARLPAHSKVIILGDMLELGDFAEAEHENIAALAIEQGFEQVILVGPLYEKIARHTGVLHFENVKILSHWFMEQVYEDTSFLIKGSRGMQLEQLLEAKA